jgi:hypothetical protein
MTTSTVSLAEMYGPGWAGRARNTAAPTAIKTVLVCRKARGQFPTSPAAGLLPTAEGDA